MATEKLEAVCNKSNEAISPAKTSASMYCNFTFSRTIPARNVTGRPINAVKLNTLAAASRDSDFSEKIDSKWNVRPVLTMPGMMAQTRSSQNDRVAAASLTVQLASFVVEVLAPSFAALPLSGSKPMSSGEFWIRKKASGVKHTATMAPRMSHEARQPKASISQTFISGKAAELTSPPMAAMLMARPLFLTNHCGIKELEISPIEPWPSSRIKKKPINSMARLVTKLLKKQAIARAKETMTAIFLEPLRSMSRPIKNSRKPAAKVALE
ncbi:hypothetical protein G159_18555 [Planococcus glaciei CHR43]|nr:hypothetical protein G159_18555 [Planococcus glaciei CHR43]